MDSKTYKIRRKDTRNAMRHRRDYNSGDVLVFDWGSNSPLAYRIKEACNYATTHVGTSKIVYTEKGSDYKRDFWMSNQLKAIGQAVDKYIQDTGWAGNLQREVCADRLYDHLKENGLLSFELKVAVTV